MTSEGLGEMFEGDSAETCARKFPLMTTLFLQVKDELNLFANGRRHLFCLCCKVSFFGNIFVIYILKDLGYNWKGVLRPETRDQICPSKNFVLDTGAEIYLRHSSSDQSVI